jgi:hypothetical protein
MSCSDVSRLRIGNKIKKTGISFPSALPKHVRARIAKALFAALLLINVALLIYPQFETIEQRQKEEIQEKVQSMAQNATVASIFGNNAVIALFGLIPILGIPIIWQILLNTGRALNALDASMLELALNPIVWMEMAAYTISTFYSVKILYCLTKRRLHKAFQDSKNAVFIIFVLLFEAAILEVLLIRGGLG